MSTYAQQLRDPRWQKRRLEVLDRDEWTCRHCGDAKSELHVHHLRYAAGKKPWEYGDEDLRTLCKPCHDEATQITRAARDTLYDMLSNDAEGAREIVNASAVVLCFCPEAAEVVVDISHSIGSLVKKSFAVRRRFSHEDYMAVMSALTECRDKICAAEEGIESGKD